jgi:hypothetical protein
MNYLPHAYILCKVTPIFIWMGLSFVNPDGFRLFVICNAIALLLLSMVKSIVDILPDQDILRFLVINMIGVASFVGSIYAGRNIGKTKMLWFTNGFTIAGLILMVYSSSIEMNGAIHKHYMPIFHVLEVIGVVYVANKVIKSDDRERYAELVKFQSTNQVSI